MLQGQASDIAIHAEEFIKLKSILNKLLAQHTGQPVETIGKLYIYMYTQSHMTPSVHYIEQLTDRDKFMSAEEARDFGMVDQVLTHDSSSNTTS